MIENLCHCAINLLAEYSPFQYRYLRLGAGASINTGGLRNGIADGPCLVDTQDMEVAQDHGLAGGIIRDDCPEGSTPRHSIHQAARADANSAR